MPETTTTTNRVALLPGILISRSLIPAEVFNPVIPGFAAYNPGIMGLKIVH